MIAALMLLFSAFSVEAQSGMPVYVEANAPDSVGNRLVYAIREGIRRSSAMTLVDREQDGFISLKIVTLNPDKSNTSLRTIYSIVWVTKTLHDTPVPMYLTNSVGVCGANRVSQCADDLVADTDNHATFVRGILRSIAEGGNLNLY